jgi:hypothetical protein
MPCQFIYYPPRYSVLTCLQVQAEGLLYMRILPYQHVYTTNIHQSLKDFNFNLVFFTQIPINYYRSQNHDQGLILSPPYQVLAIYL